MNLATRHSVVFRQRAACTDRYFQSAWLTQADYQNRLSSAQTQKIIWETQARTTINTITKVNVLL